jgi:hypothetical protein
VGGRFAPAELLLPILERELARILDHYLDRGWVANERRVRARASVRCPARVAEFDLGTRSAMPTPHGESKCTSVLQNWREWMFDGPGFQATKQIHQNGDLLLIGDISRHQ